tara:strand:- start:1107 stop:2147 length:1041 start_codon:yes stop_codon:yes gene_type:complete
MVSLIAGMDKIVEYIKTLEIKNKKLEKENKSVDKQYEELYEEIEEQKEINIQLEEEKDFWIKEHHELKVKVDWENINDYSMRIDELIDKNNKQYKKIKELEEKVDEGLKYKELKELYEGRAKGMEEELNKIEKIVGIKESRIPEPNQVLNAVNKLNEEIKELKVFKEKTEDECEASAVMEDMMKRIQEAERKEKMWYDNYKIQEPMVKANREQNEQLIKIVIKLYDLETQEHNHKGYWGDRFENFYWDIVVENREIDWWNIFEEVGIECRNWDNFKETYFEDKEIREKYCASDYVEHTQTDKIINDEDEDYDWDDQEEDFIEWYIEDYMDACGYANIEEDYYMLIR